MKLTETAPLRDELLARFEQRASESYLFKLIWLYSKTYGSTKAIADLPKQASILEYCQAILSSFNLEIQSEVPEWLLYETGQGVLVYGPHTSRLETLILPLLLGNRELYFVGIRHSLFMLPQRLGHLVLPVSPSYLAKDAPLQRHPKKMIKQVVSRKLFAYDDDRTAAEMKRDNIKIPLQVAQLLAEGKVVVIFPTASDPIDTTTWNNGIGQILIHLQQHNLQPNSVLLQSYEMTDIRFVRAVSNMKEKYVLGKQKPPTKVAVNWNTPLDYTDFASKHQVSTLSAKEIAQLMAKEYLGRSNATTQLS